MSVRLSLVNITLQVNAVTQDLNKILELQRDRPAAPPQLAPVRPTFRDKVIIKDEARDPFFLCPVNSMFAFSSLSSRMRHVSTCPLFLPINPLVCAFVP